MAIALLLAVQLLPIISGESFDLHKPLNIGQTFMASSTDPTQGSTAWALTSHGISENLFTVDQSGNIVPQVATSVTKKSALRWDVTLKDNYFFSDGTPVTAQLVAAALTEMNRENSNAQASLGNMVITPIDDLMLKIESDRATPVMDAVLAEWPFVVYKNSSDNFVFTGPFKVETFVTGERIELVPNPYYPRASERPLLVIHLFSDAEALGSAIGAGNLDLAFQLPVDLLPELRDNNTIIKSFEVGYHYMMWHNMRTTSQLSDAKVRQAVDLALDRTALTQELRGGRATRSLFPDYTPYFLDDSEQHGQKSEAEALLVEAGWNTAQGGMREKNGVPLTLDVVAYPQRTGLVTMLPLISQTLTDLGINVSTIVTSGESWDQLDQIMADKDYDLLLWAQNTLPAGDPQWFLNAFFRSDGGNNHAGLNSSSVDLLLDDLSVVEEHANRVSASAAAHTAIRNEFPVSNLMTPEWHVGLSSRLSTYQPWGSDYYVIRADLGLAESSDQGGDQSTTSQSATDGGGRAMCGGISLVIFLIAASRFMM